MFQEFSRIIKKVFYRMIMKPKCQVTLNIVVWRLITKQHNNLLEQMNKRNNEVLLPIEISKIMALPG